MKLLAKCNIRNKCTNSHIFSLFWLAATRGRNLLFKQSHAVSYHAISAQLQEGLALVLSR